MVKLPNCHQVAAIADDLGFGLDPDEVRMFTDLVKDPMGAYAALDALPDNLPLPRWPRTPGYVPDAQDNPFGAVQRFVDVAGAETGPLAGREIVIKDCVALAGVPMMNGSAIFEGYTPEVDATVVERLLDAGARIVAKTANEDYCFSGGSHTNARGPVDNPWQSGYTAGGSSSGTAALVGGGVVDLGIGTDQGGSVRVPAACCGAVGMKPTFGLVPCSGNLGMEPSIDHIGPITKTVADNALVLSVIAGPDGLDARQQGAPAQEYATAIDEGIAGLRIGLLTEGFAAEGSDARVNDAVKTTTAALEDLGASVVDISVPLHLVGGAIWLPRAAEGCMATMFHGNGFGFGPKGLYLPSAMQRQAQWRGQAHLMHDTVKLGMLMGEYMLRTYGGRYYGKAQNLSRHLGAAYDAALQEVDVLIMPTLPFLPPRRPRPEDGREAGITSAFGMTSNTSPFNATGHPSLSIPCGTIDGLPVGLMVTGPMLGEGLLYRVAAAIESQVGPLSKPT
ncbi:amidase [Antarcticimicrobium sediminis]|uniref:Amidase n=1 Tax=Antarcticimicrobium sediminis TaxID=2546227 RepID=A0A4R5EH87_9RHOB|nr:amidase [Antarcticimicrobium sediminis]TDE33728.1 amidase [Antarcticimicrobium sediminis]